MSLKEKTITTRFKGHFKERMEDKIFVGDKRLGIIDGASSSTDLNDYPHSGEFTADILHNAFHLENLKLSEVFETASTMAQAKYQSLTGNTLENVPKQLRSSSSFVLAEIDIAKNLLIYVQSGDCMLFIQYNDGSIKQVTKDSFEEFEKMHVNSLYEKLPENYTIDDFKTAQENTKKLISKNKEYMNTLGGYSAFDGSNTAYNYFDKGMISLENVSQILLLTDGLKSSFNDTSDSDWVFSAKKCFGEYVNMVCYKHILHNKELEDELCSKGKRFKVSDDKAGILYSI